ncbi:hypothetical protein [Leyella stercorea]|uniref:hypothetical protein n=1 Tax=Leyella stercorea TaxID=363265 RepID=UPI003A9248D4
MATLKPGHSTSSIAARPAPTSTTETPDCISTAICISLTSLCSNVRQSSKTHTLSIGGYSILAIPTQSVGGYSIPAIPTQSAAWGGCVEMACGWRWGGCVGMAGMPYPPINTSAPTDADVCVDRCRWLRRPMRMSASTDADVCADRCRCLRRPMRMSASTDANHAGRTFLLWQAAKPSAARL